MLNSLLTNEEANYSILIHQVAVEKDVCVFIFALRHRLSFLTSFPVKLDANPFTLSELSCANVTDYAHGAITVVELNSHTDCDKR